MARAKFKVWIEPSGMAEIRNSAEVQEVLTSIGNDIAGRAEGNYRVETKGGKTRAHCNVLCDDPKTWHSNLKHNHLLKAMK